MPRSAAVLSKNDQANGSAKEPESNGTKESEKKRSFRLNSVLTPEMIQEPYPLDFADGMDSYDFAREKCSRQIINALKFSSQKEWLDFAKDCWIWVENTSDREAKAQADHLLERIKNLIEETQDNPKLNQLIKEKLADVVDS